MTPRVRRDPSDAKRLILEAAEQLLTAGGVGAVQVRAVAAKVGITDAAINHHFGSRDQLLEALLKHGGARLKERVRSVTRSGPDIKRLVGSIAEAYSDGYTDLALALHQSGWRDSGSGILSPAVDALHEMACARADELGRPQPDRRRAQLTVAAVHQALALEPAMGEEFRRSAGLTDGTSAEMLTWWEQAVSWMVDGWEC
jgi:TetR/AcrR family transcriptional regulator, repressor for neighboring sulfatase